MAVSIERFRDVLGRLAGGVCVVTTRGPDGQPRGLTATSVCSVSLEPPLVLVCLASSSRTHDAIGASGVFAVNFLGAADAEVADRFAGADEEKFAGLASREEATGAPLLSRGLGYCDCVVTQRIPAGDHTVFIGQVEAAAASGSVADPGLPLLHYRGAYLPALDDGTPGDAHAGDSDGG